MGGAAVTRDHLDFHRHRFKVRAAGITGATSSSGSRLVINTSDPIIVNHNTEGEYRRLGGPVSEELAGRRIDRHLAREFPFLSRVGWQERLAAGGLLVNGRSVKNAARLKLGDQLLLHAPKTVEPEVDRGVRVLWEEDGVMAIFKPGNLPMHENGPYRKNTFTWIVWQEVGREWSAVHRLDRETSGIVLCGNTSQIRSQLARDLAQRKMRKEYLAIARGIPQCSAWRSEGAIGNLMGSAIRIKKWVVPGGLNALTEFIVLDTVGDSCLLEARPQTGRTNQIRIHAAHAGHALYGDKLYHPDEAVFLEYFERGQTTNVTVRTGFTRLCLHAKALTFTHPVHGREVRVEAPLPPDLAGFWAELKAGGGQLSTLPVDLGTGIDGREVAVDSSEQSIRVDAAPGCQMRQDLP